MIAGIVFISLVVGVAFGWCIGLKHGIALCGLNGRDGRWDRNYCPECSAFLPSESHKPMCSCCLE